MIDDLSNWTPRPRPAAITLEGRFLSLETFDREKHQDDLWEALGGIEGANERMNYFPNDPYANADEFGAWLFGHNDSGSYQTMVFRSAETSRVVGMASYMRMDPANGVIEVGAVAHGLDMARSRLSTEAHFLMASYIFDELEYRRYEWKLNNNNQPSHSAAKRFGFTFEGVFRQHIVAKGQNRDTAWYAIIDKDWPTIKAAFENWLADDNFDKGVQVRRLEDIRESLMG